MRDLYDIQSADAVDRVMSQLQRLLAMHGDKRIEATALNSERDSMVLQLTLKPSLAGLPNELLRYVWAQLQPFEHYLLAPVCQYWHHCVSSDAQLWRFVCVVNRRPAQAFQDIDMAICLPDTSKEPALRYAHHAMLLMPSQLQYIPNVEWVQTLAVLNDLNLVTSTALCSLRLPHLVSLQLTMEYTARLSFDALMTLADWLCDAAGSLRLRNLHFSGNGVDRAAGSIHWFGFTLHFLSRVYSALEGDGPLSCARLSMLGKVSLNGLKWLPQAQSIATLHITRVRYTELERALLAMPALTDLRVDSIEAHKDAFDVEQFPGWAHQIKSRSQPPVKLIFLMLSKVAPPGLLKLHVEASLHLGEADFLDTSCLAAMPSLRELVVVLEMCGAADEIDLSRHADHMSEMLPQLSFLICDGMPRDGIRMSWLEDDAHVFIPGLPQAFHVHPDTRWAHNMALSERRSNEGRRQRFLHRFAPGAASETG